MRLKRRQKANAAAVAEVLKGGEINVSFEPVRMVFSVGGVEFYLNRITAVRLFGVGIDREFEEAGENDGLGNLKNFVRIGRLLGKGLDYASIGKVMGFPPDRIRAYYSRLIGTPALEKPWGVNEYHNELTRQTADEMDRVPEPSRPAMMGEREAPEPGSRLLDLRHVRRLQAEGLAGGKLAAALGVDPDGLTRFLELNQKYLDLLR